MVNVANLKAGGMGSLGAEQLEWLEKDLKGKSASTPLIIFAHIPLWSVYPEWGWGTEDGTQALALLKRTGSEALAAANISADEIAAEVGSSQPDLYDAEIKCIDSCQSADKPAKYPPVLNGNYLYSKFSAQSNMELKAS